MTQVPASPAQPNQVFDLFPTPILRAERLVDVALIDALTAEIEQSDRVTNAYSDLLSHTPIAGASANDLFSRLATVVAPKVVEFGELLFGEALRWQIKEMWVNVLEPGGRQAIHTHANSFISGVVYLTDAHRSANIVFHRAIGGNGYIFGNHHSGARVNAYNGGKWSVPATTAGDLVLFPSYLLHEVPPNQGERRISIAFNAIPDRLDNFGYAVRFA